VRVELILEAIDKASGVINKVRDAARGLEGVAKSEQFAKAQEKAAQRQQEAVVGMAAATSTAASVGLPIQRAVTAWNGYEDKLTDVGLKGDLIGGKLNAMSERVRAQSRALNTNSTDLMKGIETMIEGGLAAEKAESALGAVARASIATKAAIADVGTAVVGFVNNAKIAPQDIEKGLGALIQTGKDGNFEFKSMVQYMPRLTSLYADLGKTGVGALAELGAMMQVVNGVTNNPQTTAAGVRDMLNKIQSDKSVAAFKDIGIDIVDVMNKARAAGRPLEAIVESLQKIAGSDPMKINEIFGDVQAQTAARALLQNVEKLFELRDRALGATGVIDADFARRMGLGVEKVNAFNVAMSELWTTAGAALAPSFNAKIEKLTQLVWQIEAWVKLNPELAAGIAKAATAVALLLVGMAALKLVWAVLGSGLLTFIGILGRLVTIGRLLLIPFAFLKGVLGGIAAGISAAGGVSAIAGALLARFGAVLRFLLAPLAMAARGVMMLGAAMLTTPIGWIVMGIAAVAAGAYYVYKNWATIGPMLARVWGRLVATAKTVWDGVTQAFADAWTGVKAWFASLEWPSLPEFPDVLGGLSRALDPALTWVGEWGGKLGKAFEGAFGKIGDFLSGAGERIGKLISPLTDALTKAGEFVFGPSTASVKATAEQAAAAKAAIDAIPPAAREAVVAANAVLSAQNWQSHGVRLMQTLAAGIRAGSAEAVAAVRDTVQKMRDHLPHSPAKVGPLSDLDRVQFAQTLAGAITRGAPRAIMAAQALAAGLAATVPDGAMAAGGMATPPSRAAAGGQASSGGDVTVNPVFHVTVQGGGGEDFKEQMRAYSYELAEIIQAELKRRERATY
jgi:TP901 family phage tail tape measure protein